MPISLEKVSYRPPSAEPDGAVSDVSLSVADGEFVGIMGHAGCGKSSLLRVMSGLQRPDSGSVSVEAGQPGSGKSRARAAYFTPSSQLALCESTARKELLLSLRRSELDKEEKDRRVEEALSALGLGGEKYAELSPFAWSESERRLLALAAIIVARPSLLLLDEPFSGLDAPSRERAEQLFARLSLNGLTIVAACNDSEFLAKYAKRVIIMDKGSVVRDGSAKSVFTDYYELMRRGLPVPAVRETARQLWQREVNMPENIISYQQFIDRLKIIVWRRDK